VQSPGRWCTRSSRVPECGPCLLYCGASSPPVGRAKTNALAVLSVENFHQACIVPVFDVVVRAIVDLDFDGVAAIVDKEYEDRKINRIIWQTSRLSSAKSIELRRMLTC
jgi:hypothetical protein